MKINILLNKKNTYLQGLKEYLAEEKKKCLRNGDNKYFVVTYKYISEIEEMLNYEQNDEIDDKDGFDKKATKYMDFVEAYRLARYQFSRYSQISKSSVECVYSTILLEILKKKKKCVDDALRILDVGCGPSRLGFELSGIFEKSTVDLFDFSYINLFLAHKIISTTDTVDIPVRAFEKNSDIECVRIDGMGRKNISYNIFDFSENITDVIDSKYDIIVASHSINLFTNPQKTIEQLFHCLKSGGIFVMADLFGWKEDREKERRAFYDANSFYEYMSNHDEINVVDFFRVGPYCEEVNAERIDSYVSHIVVLEKK